MFLVLQKRVVWFLRKLERYTKTDMVYLFSGGSLSIVTQIVGIGASLLFAVVVSHFLPKEVYGEYKYVLAIIATLSLFSLNGMGSAVLQSVAQGFGGVLKQGFYENLRWSVLVFVGALLLAIYYFLAHNTRLAEEILIGGSFSPFLASASLYSPFLGGKKAFVRQQLYGIIDNILPILAMTVTVLVTNNPVILIATYFVFHTLSGFFFYLHTRRRYKEEINDPNMITYSKHLSIMGVLNGIATNLDQILLFHFVGAAQLAVYNFAIAIPDQMKGPSKTIDTMIQVRFVKRRLEEVQAGMGNKFLWLAVVSITVAVLYIVVAPILFAYFFPKYISAVPYSQIYALWIISMSLDPASSYLWAKKRLQAQYTNTIVYSITQILLMIIGVLWFGLMGVIIARVCTRFFLALLNYIFYYREVSART